MSAEATTLETQARPWWVMLIEGIALTIIGAVLLFAPNKTRAEFYVALIMLLGIYWIISGIMALVSMFRDHTAWGWKLFIGIVSIIAGAYLVMYPIAMGVFVLPQTMVLVMGIWGLMQGILYLIMAFKGAGWGIGILGGILVLLGLYLAINYAAPGMGLAMIWAVAITSLLGGIIMIVFSFLQRSA